MALSPEARRSLKAQAHHLKPLIIVGQKGITETLIEATDQALEAHELIKIKFNEYKEEKEDLVREISEATSGEKVAIIGNIAILYRKKKKK